MSSRPDWIRLIGLESQVPWLMDRLRADYGECVPHSGAKFFRAGALWHPGILVSWGHKSEIAMIDLQGSRLACTPVEEFMQLSFELLKRGFRCTRIDLAVDHVDLGIDLHKHALASCKAGELCKLRTYSDDSEFKADGTPLRYLLKLGKRTSPICARIYDKGLETKTLPAGQWERFEVEFKDDRANEVCMALADAGDKLHELLWGYVIGAVEFRVANGRSEFARRPFTKWWERYIGQTTPLRCPPQPSRSGYIQWKEWFRESAGRRLIQLANIFECRPSELFYELIDGLEPAFTETSCTIEAREMHSNRREAMPTAAFGCDRNTL
ncbi:MAG: replication initiation factor domain-containing protein [Phycisphaerales bacterium]|nr:replication initiation factor domain-containing protein [Phycisphaerales bacterium]